MARGCMIDTPASSSTAASAGTSSRMRSVSDDIFILRCRPARRTRRQNDLLLGQSSSLPRQVGDDRALAEDVDVVAELQLVHLGRVPDEGPAGLGLGADHAVDLLLGADVDAAHRVVHQHHRRRARERPGEQHLLLVAARQRQDRCCSCPACGCRSARARSAPRPRFGAGRSASAATGRGSERSSCSSAIDQSGKMPSVWRSPATKATRPVGATSWPRCDAA